MVVERDKPLQYWQKVAAKLKTIELEGSENEIMSTSDLDAFEDREDIVLPTEYKEFCHFFGSGTFGTERVHINCPTSYWITQIAPAQLEGMKMLISTSTEQKVSDNFNLFSELLDHAFVFGGYDYYVVFWDLRTYDKLDDSYDIYWALTDVTWGDIYKVGRSFSNFIRNFCLSNEHQKLLPDDLHPSFDPDDDFTFTQTSSIEQTNS